MAQNKDYELRCSKALVCFYKISKLIGQQELSINEVLQQIAELLPSGIENSENRWARITFDGKRYISSNFRETTYLYNDSISCQGKNIGKIEVFYAQTLANSKKQYISKEDKEFIDTVNRLIGQYHQKILIENDLRISLKDSEQRETEVNSLLNAARAVLKQEEFQNTARHIFNSCKNLIGAQAGYVALLSEDGSENEVLFLDSGKEECTVDPNLPMPIRGMRQKVYENKQTYFENQFSSSSYVEFLPEGHVFLKNVLFSPLLIENKVVGLLGLANKEGGFTKNDSRIASAFGEMAAIALINSQTLDSLENSEKRFRALAQSASDAVINIDSAGNIVFWNEAAAKIFGFSREEILGNPVSILIPSKFRKKHQNGLARTVSTGKSNLMGRTVELTGIRKNKQEFQIGLSLSTWKIDNETFFTGIVRDVSIQKELENELRRSKVELEKRVKERTRKLTKTNISLQNEIIERKQAEVSLEKERSRLYSVLDQLPALVHLKGKDYKIRFANRLFRERFGLPEDRPCYKILHNLDSPCSHCQPFDVFENLHTQETEEIHSDGRLYQIFNYPFTDTDGTLLVLQLGIDITEKSKVEKSLQASEERLRLLVNSLNDTVFTLNKEEKITAIYGNIVHTMGIQSKDILGKTLRDIFKPQDKLIHHRAVKKALKGENVVYEWMLKQPEGERHIKNVLSPIYDADGKINTVVGIARDITRQKILERQTIQNEKLMAHAEISAMISHEFRNSLTSVRMILELQLESTQLNPSEIKSLSVALSSIQHMEDIVSQLLSFSKPSPIVLKKSELNALLEESISFSQPQIQNANIKLFKTLEPKIPMLMLDPKHLKEAFINLILNGVNAISANPKKGSKSEINLKTLIYEIPEKIWDSPNFINAEIQFPEESLQKSNLVFEEGEVCVLVEVSDSGMGIPENIINKIFDPFFSTMTKGTGLGLAMVKRTINAHGGIIKVMSQGGKGTTFKVYLPIKRK